MKAVVEILENIKLRFASKAEPKNAHSKDRRDHGMNIRLWNDKDPRADQSFFLGGVPGFVLSQDQRIIDWNIAFEIAFKGIELKRGMLVSEWYRLLDNFRRIPNREAKLFGEAVVPITDRERVVFVSQTYGRMVFMKLMSPILDRVSGRIIGWNITLNVNSVSERVKFFEELYERIDAQSRRARYVVGAEQILARSSLHLQFVDSVASQLSGRKNIVVLGAVKSESLIENLLATNDNVIVTVVDTDADALRLLRTQCAAFQKRLKLVRRAAKEFSKLSFSRFDAVVVLHPRFTAGELTAAIKHVGLTIPHDARMIFAGYCTADAATNWWLDAKSELEQIGAIDVLKWHWQTVSQEDVATYGHAVVLPSSSADAERFFRHIGLELEGATFGLLSGNGVVLVSTPSLKMSRAV